MILFNDLLDIKEIQCLKFIFTWYNNLLSLIYNAQLKLTYTIFPIPYC